VDHKSFLKALSAEEKAALTETEDAAGLWRLAGHLGLILACGAPIAAKVPLWWVLLPVQGVLMVFLFTLEHECTHKTPFRAPALSDWVGRLCGMVLLLPFEWFRYFHLAHHRHTNIPGLDPELASEKPETVTQWVWHVSGLPYWAAGMRLMAALVMGRTEEEYLPQSARSRIVREARVMALIYLALALTLIWSPMLLWVWIVPVLVGQPALRLYLLAEHGDCPRVTDMFENTRTTFTNRIVRFVAWNMPYHAEHHVFPAVPFHKLPALHLKMRDHLKVTADGYAAFTRDYLDRRM
jgi:fatty acid desaturase